MSYNRVLEFNNLLQEQKFYPQDIIYDQDSGSKVFYIVKRGKVSIQAIIEIESQNVHHQSKNKEWKIIKTKRRCMYKVRDVGPGEILGHEELLLHFENVCKTGDGKQKVPKRQYRVIAEEKSDLFFLNIEKFYFFFSDSELRKMEKHINPINMEEIEEKVRVHF